MDTVVCHLDPHVKTKAVTSPAAVNVADIGVRLSPSLGTALVEESCLGTYKCFSILHFFVSFKIQGFVF